MPEEERLTEEKYRAVYPKGEAEEEEDEDDGGDDEVEPDPADPIGPTPIDPWPVYPDFGNTMVKEKYAIFGIVRGYKQYELSNHLGNVLTTLSDKKGYNLQSDYYLAEILSAQDYYPGGMLQPGRVYSNSDYRYGYNGMEMDDEVKGSGNSYTTEFRQYDPRLGKWLSIDPLFANFPWQSPYAAFDNNPIYFKDPKGLAAEGGENETVGQKATRVAITSIAEAANKKSGGELAKEASDNDVNAYQLFYQWVKGTGSDSRNFDENSTMGQQMLQAPEVKSAIDGAVNNAFCEDNCTPVDFARTLRDENPAFYALYDFPKDVSGENPARGFHGSFSGNVVVDAVVPLEGGGTMIKMTVSIRDRMTATSGTRLSGTVGGYNVENPAAVYKTENPYGADGQFRTINVKYNMQVTVIL